VKRRDAHSMATDSNRVLQVQTKFAELPLREPGISWTEAVLKLGPKFGITDENGRPRNKSASNFLKILHKAFRRGQKPAKVAHSARKTVVKKPKRIDRKTA